MPNPLEMFLRKHTLASELRTAEMDAVEAWTREQSFTMASVARMEVLQANRSKVAGILSGNLTEYESRTQLRDMLNDIGYQSPAGLKGSIKDLSTDERMNATLRTNVELAQGWAQKQAYAGSTGFPGLRLYRRRQSASKRNWIDRCARFAGRPDVALTGIEDAPMVALSNSSVWVELSRFGVAYPPFDYGSGMHVKPVSYEECVELGLITPENEQKVMDSISKERVVSLNENWSAKPQISERALRDALSEQLKGLATWEGDTLRMTDPNGTRQYAWQDVGKVINAELPEGIPNLQAKALRHWVENHYAFSCDVSEHNSAGLDEREDFWRLVSRIKPVNSKEYKPLYRGMTVPQGIIANWEKSGVYKTQEHKIVDSWSVAESGSNKYLKDTLPKGSANVMLVMNDYNDARIIHQAIRDVGQIKSPNPKQILETDGEILTKGGMQYAIKKKWKKGNVTYLEVIQQ